MANPTQTVLSNCVVKNVTPSITASGAERAYGNVMQVNEDGNFQAGINIYVLKGSVIEQLEAVKFEKGAKATYVNIEGYFSSNEKNGKWYQNFIVTGVSQ